MSVTLIVSNTLTVPTATIGFTGIAASHNNLLVVGSLRSTATATLGDILAYLNGDTGANYSYVQEIIKNVGVTTTAGADVSGAHLGSISAANAQAAAFSQIEAMFSNVLTASAYTTSQVRLSAAIDPPFAYNTSFYWTGNQIVADIVLAQASGNFAAGSILSLYGYP